MFLLNGINKLFVNVGDICHEAGDLVRSLQMYEKPHALSVKLLGPDDSRVSEYLARVIPAFTG